MVRLLLTLAIPFQTLIDSISPTHGFINGQALTILSADGRSREASWLSRNLEPFCKGCDWADKGWKNAGHMFDPKTRRGLRGLPTAPQMVRDYWQAAVRQAARGREQKAAFYLGAAAHIVQDMCVPHHAAAELFEGHRRFEEVARENRDLFAVTGDGIYGLSRTPEGWAVTNATYTRLYYSACLNPSYDPDETRGAIADLLPRAQRSTAGFVSHFLSTLEVA